VPRECAASVLGWSAAFRLFFTTAPATLLSMEILRKAVELMEAGEKLILVTIIEAGAGTPGKPGFKMIVRESGGLHGTVGGGALEARAIDDARRMFESREGGLKSYDLGTLGMKCGGKASLLFELLEGCQRFVLFGGGHVGRALAPILQSLGFRVTVYDPRAEVRQLLSESPLCTLVQGEYDDIAPVRSLLEACEFCFIATHGHEHDYQVLKQVLSARPAYRYVGLIGSRSKVRSTLKRLAADGLQRPPFLYAPVGLPLGGGTPAEIAVSIAAEVLVVRHGGTLPHMRDSLE
jgi:xanthine dehydrogenase accessory factor